VDVLARFDKVCGRCCNSQYRYTDVAGALLCVRCADDTQWCLRGVLRPSNSQVLGEEGHLLPEEMRARLLYVVLVGNVDLKGNECEPIDLF
jgi:hypothetical protein